MPGPRWPLPLCAALLATSRAFAQGGGEDVATAQALFDEGKRLMQEGHYDEACPKLVESQRLDPGGGTLLAIALCHEAQGKLATAWGDFNVAASEARKDRRADRESAAMEHVRALEPRLPRLRIVVAAKLDGLEVHRDGALVGAPQWGTALPIDPGVHRFDARAPGKKGWETTVTVPGEPKTVELAIPPLEDAPLPAAPPPVAPVSPVSAPPASPASAPSPAGNPMRTWGLVTGGVALAFVGVGAGFGVSATSKWHDAQSSCVAGRCTNPGAPQLGTDAGHAADLSTVFFTVGGVGVAASVVLLVVSAGEHGHATAGSLRVSPLVGGITGLAIGGDL